MDDERTIHLPLEVLDKCDECGQSGDSHRLRICSYCGERAYCSTECQKKDWPTHKASCGKSKTDRIPLTAFYPFLACLAEACRFHPSKPHHPAQTHAILNSPNPGSQPARFPDGTEAVLVLLGESVPFTVDPAAWWPTAISSPVRSKFFRRLQREGYLLSLVLSLCIALLQEVYTTTSAPDGSRRIRLQYKNSPISDFGILKGAASVTNQDQLAYFNLSDLTFRAGQDPKEHYWLYFKTLSGQEITLDCGMFTFNFGLVVHGAPYGDSIPLPIPPATAPAFVFDPVTARTTPHIAEARERFSVLRDAGLQQALSGPEIDWSAVYDFMDRVAGGACPDIEKDLVKVWSRDNARALQKVFQRRAWTRWPAEPAVDIEADPGEMHGRPPVEDEEWWNYMERWNRKYNRGRVTRDELGNAFRRFQARRAGAE
ncbi:hypothetical protein Hypma_016372 [Hypsizygus marmoreus]|uniref:MYND-type domain-containing protein n=1 Tax=Hypsizygus marmoreus TaxID=39966 RepID=A0A369IYP5_HYPMA|nr:hypothetical protein Hypma_016372 [Hypsizygus marmoreus]